MILKNKNEIIAQEGKVFRRIADQSICGTKICLGYRWYEAGKKLETPILETKDMYEEIDDPNIKTVEEEK